MPSIKFKVALRGYDKKTDLMVKEEYSKIFDESDTIINELGLHDEFQIFDGGFNVLPEWLPILQPYFEHTIVPAACDYQISFRYQGIWPFSPAKAEKTNE